MRNTSLSVNRNRQIKGESYLEICVLVLVISMVLAVSLSVFSVYIKRVEMEKAAMDILNEASQSGLLESEKISQLKEDYQKKYGFIIRLSSDDCQKTKDGWAVPFGKEIFVRVENKALLKGIGNAGKWMDLCIERKARSEKYRKQ